MKEQEVLNVGRQYIEFIKNDPVLGLDGTEASMKNVQAWIESLHDEGSAEKLFDEYKSRAMIGLAVYIGDLLVKQLPNFNFQVLLKGDSVVEEIQLKDKANNLINLLSWVTKCYQDPEGDNVEYKFKSTLDAFRKSA
jgi:hypothetical protein